MKPSGIYTASLCWSCAKTAGGLGCSWIDKKPSGSYPVQNWKTEVQMRYLNNKKFPQKIYIVKDCPLFEEG